MTDNPVFTVFLDKEKVENLDLSYFPDGIPCLDYFASDKEKIVPKNFLFIVDKERLNLNQSNLLHIKYGLSIIYASGEEQLFGFLIPFEDVLSAVDWNGDTRPLEVLKHSWLITNHAKKIEKVNTNLDGETAHLLIMGLQQALFIESTEEPLMNDYLLRLAIKLIDCMAMDNKELKEAYLTGFPCEYISKSRELLFS